MRASVGRRIAGLVGGAAIIAAVVLNVTVTQSEGDGFVTVFPGGTVAPETSNLNFTNGTASTTSIGDAGTGSHPIAAAVKSGPVRFH